MTDTPDNIVQIETLRIARRLPKKCTCKQRKYTVDTENREITCGCGMVVDAFEALSDLADRYDTINREHVSLNEQRKQWLKEKPHSVMFKSLERSYNKGTMLPYCPKCEKLFDFKDVTAFGNAEFYRKLEERKREEANKVIDSANEHWNGSH
jgi:hypothetical protein